MSLHLQTEMRKKNQGEAEVQVLEKKLPSLYVHITQNVDLVLTSRHCSALDGTRAMDLCVCRLCAASAALLVTAPSMADSVDKLWECKIICMPVSSNIIKTAFRIGLRGTGLSLQRSNQTALEPPAQ